MTKKKRTWGAVAGTIGLIAAPVGVVLVAPQLAGAAPGNNGTVKIAPHGDVDSIPQNAPHQGCTFQVEWFGFDEGSNIISTVTFTDHSPTGGAGMTVSGPSTVFVGGDDASGAGNDFDGVAVYTLSFTGAPHPQQGYHVKLTIHTPESHGATVKHKVFWVQGCGVPPPTTPTPTTTTPTPTTTTPTPTTTTPTPTTTTPSVTTTHTTTVSPATQTPTPVAGEQEEAAEDDVEVKDEQPVKQPPPQEQVQEAQPEVAGAQAEIPTVVNAGLSGDSQAAAAVPPWALGMGAAGLAFLAIALILSRVARARRGGAHAAR